MEPPVIGVVSGASAIGGVAGAIDESALEGLSPAEQDAYTNAAWQSANQSSTNFVSDPQSLGTLPGYDISNGPMVTPAMTTPIHVEEIGSMTTPNVE